MMSNEELLEFNGYDADEIKQFRCPNFEGALIGVSEDNRAIYDFDLMVKSLMDNEGWDEVEAISWIDTNTIRSIPYETNAPIIMYRLEGVGYGSDT